MLILLDWWFVTEIAVCRVDFNEVNVEVWCDVQEFFEEQLGKHSKTISLIEQNLSAQDNILRALTDTNAKYARIRKDNTEITNK